MTRSRVLLISPMVIFGAAGAALLFYWAWGDAETRFHSELLPELIGFCLEAFILVGLLTLVQHARESARRRELRLSLRGSFRSMLSRLDAAFLDPYAEPVSGRRLERDPSVVGQLIDELDRKHPDLDSLAALKRDAKKAVPLTRDLVGVAAQISPMHMNWWVAIVDAIRRIADATERVDLEQAIHDMLVNIQEFDRLEY